MIDLLPKIPKNLFIVLLQFNSIFKFQFNLSSMAILSSKKSTINKRNKNSESFNQLPSHLVSDILARVASSSFTDLFNAKSTCKDLHQASTENQIYERVSIDSLPVIPWKKTKNNNGAGAASFLKKCNDAGNSESLFRRGMIDYFSESRSDSGLENLRKASEKGHPAAKYVCSVILVCYGGKFREEGLKLGSDLKSMVGLCREKVRKVVKSMWVRDYIVKIGGEGEEELRMRIRNCSCGKTTSYFGKVEIKKKKAMGWRNVEEFDDGVSCDGCLWDVEAVRFCYMLKTGRFSCPFRPG